jgi:L-lysine 2,3-aminomutase
MTKELTKDEKHEIIKSGGDPFLRYQEQILRLMPEEEANNLLLARRIGKIATDSLT